MVCFFRCDWQPDQKLLAKTSSFFASLFMQWSESPILPMAPQMAQVLNALVIWPVDSSTSAMLIWIVGGKYSYQLSICKGCTYPLTLQLCYVWWRDQCHLIDISNRSKGQSMSWVESGTSCTKISFEIKSSTFCKSSYT